MSGNGLSGRAPRRSRPGGRARTGKTQADQGTDHGGRRCAAAGCYNPPEFRRKRDAAMRTPLALFAVLVAAATALAGQPAGAATGDPLYPNLQPLPASDVRLETSTVAGQTVRTLRFSTTSRNVGRGPLELVADAGDANTLRQNVYQRVYREGGGLYSKTLVGQFVFHPEHNHFHFEGYASYQLFDSAGRTPASPPGAKTTFCVMDTTRIDTRLPGAPKTPVYSTCGASVQGMSVGWGDRYGYTLAGQEIDASGVADGDYLLRIVIDPTNRLQETDDGDNLSDLPIRLAGTTVTVLSGPGRKR